VKKKLFFGNTERRMGRPPSRDTKRPRHRRGRLGQAVIIRAEL
jgi:hypothetical protein